MGTDETMGSAEAAAEAFGVTPQAIRLWCKQGAPRTRAEAVPGKAGRRGWRYDVREIGEWLLANGKATRREVGEAVASVCGTNKSKPKSPRPKSADVAAEQSDDLLTAKLKAQLAKLRADIKHRELLNAERERTHVAVGTIRDLVMTCAAEFRRAGEILERDFGAQAREIVDHACTKVERKVASMGAA